MPLPRSKPTANAGAASDAQLVGALAVVNANASDAVTFPPASATSTRAVCAPSASVAVFTDSVPPSASLHGTSWVKGGAQNSCRSITLPSISRAPERTPPPLSAPEYEIDCTPASAPPALSEPPGGLRNVGALSSRRTVAMRNTRAASLRPPVAAQLAAAESHLRSTVSSVLPAGMASKRSRLASANGVLSVPRPTQPEVDRHCSLET